jgi:cation diffusion facilitator family transporter
LDEVQKLAIGSVVLGVVVFVLKLAAWWVTGSVALLSDALESIINIAAAVAALLAVRYSALPADANHPYGHSKVEYFSSVLEGALIVIAAVAILREAWGALQAPQPIDAPALGLAINGAASLLNATWAFRLARRARALRSPALGADARHLFTDVVTSVGVLVGVALVGLTGWTILDPLLAGAVAVNILWSGFGLMRESVGGLMDEAPPERDREHIRNVISAHADGALEAHDVRIRHAGRRTFIEFHLVVDGGMSVACAHDICDRIEAALRQDNEDAMVTIHVEPESKAKHTGVPVV